MIIDKTYFIRSIELPAQNLKNIQQYIDLYVVEFLIKSLGFELFFEFKVGLEQATIEQKWLDLRDGKVFEINGVQYKWNGFVNEEKESMLSYYVFSMYLQDLMKKMGTSGVFQIFADSAKNVNPNNLIINSWNNANNLQLNDKASLYNFIFYTNSENLIYDNWIFENIGKQNIFGI